MTAWEQRQVGLGGGGRCLTGFRVLANTLLLGGAGDSIVAWRTEGGLPNDQAGRKAPGTIDCVSMETATFTQRLEFQERHPSRHLLNKRAPESVVAGFWNPSQTLGGALHGGLPHPRRPCHAARGKDRRQRTQPPKLSRISQAFTVKLEPGRRHKPQQRRK